MDIVLFVDDHIELCKLVRPFLEEKGININYCEQSESWALTMTALPITLLSTQSIQK